MSRKASIHSIDALYNAKTTTICCNLRQFVVLRVESRLSQAALAARCGLAQQQISNFEAGVRIPSLEQTLRIARVLGIPIQRFLTGEDHPSVGGGGLVIELRRFGVFDLRVDEVPVPGAFRRPEEVINLALMEDRPDPRILEALPTTLAWSELDPGLLGAQAVRLGTTRRLAWLADVVLAIEMREGFPGGCGKAPLERFLRSTPLASEAEDWDDLGQPSVEPPTAPIWRRWKIRYDADLTRFRDRAEHLHELKGLDPVRLRPGQSPVPQGGERRRRDDRERTGEKGAR